MAARRLLRSARNDMLGGRSQRRVSRYGALLTTNAGTAPQLQRVEVRRALLRVAADLVPRRAHQHRRPRQRATAWPEAVPSPSAGPATLFDPARALTPEQRGPGARLRAPGKASPPDSATSMPYLSSASASLGARRAPWLQRPNSRVKKMAEPVSMSAPMSSFGLPPGRHRPPAPPRSRNDPLRRRRTPSAYARVPRAAAAGKDIGASLVHVGPASSSRAPTSALSPSSATAHPKRSLSAPSAAVSFRALRPVPMLRGEDVGRATPEVEPVSADQRTLPVG